MYRFKVTFFHLKMNKWQNAATQCVRIYLSHFAFRTSHDAPRMLLQQTDDKCIAEHSRHRRQTVTAQLELCFINHQTKSKMDMHTNVNAQKVNENQRTEEEERKNSLKLFNNCSKLSEITVSQTLADAKLNSSAYVVMQREKIANSSNGTN